MYSSNSTSYSNVEFETKKEFSSDMKENYSGNEQYSGAVMPPVFECPTERVIHREFYHEVPQDCLVLQYIV